MFRGTGRLPYPAGPGTIESIIRFARTSSTAYPQGTQSGPPVHLAVPENCCGLTLILAVFDRCGKGALAFSATGSARASFPRARGRLCGTPRACPRGVLGIKLLIDACFSIIMTSNMGRIGCTGANRLWDREPSPVPCMGAEVMMNGWSIFSVEEKQL